MSLPAPRVRRVLVIGLAFAIAAISCGRELTAPNGALRFARGISWNAIFPQVLSQVGVSGTGIVPFTRVHIVLRHADGSIALDTVVDFPSTASSVPVTLTVPLAAGAPATGEVLSLNLAYINAAGDTVFRGGPTPVLAAPTVPGAPAPPPVSIPVTYTGPGASATTLRISPRQLAVGAGNTFNFSAIASGPSGAIPGTPIVWTSLDQSLATINSPGAGAGSALTVRGSVRIVAQLLTGPADTATLIIQPTPANIALVSGNTQTGPTGAQLALPVTVLVRATDGLPMQGVSVAFAAANGGVVGAATVVTDASGLAQTTWRLGSLVGAQSLTATAAGLSGSPITFTATATAAQATKLAITTQPPATTTVGTALAPVVVTVQDVNSNTATTFTGPVTVAFGTNTVGALLSGTTTVNAVAGIATFSTLSVNKVGANFTLVATSPLLTSATSNTFATTAGAAARLAFTTAINGSLGGVTLTPTITVAAVDSFGNAVTTFTDTVRVAIANNPGSATLSGTVKATAVAGVASFATLAIDKAGSGYTLAASATGLITATSVPFDVIVGPASNLMLVSGGAQSGPISTALPLPVIVKVTDIGGNGVAGKTVTFATANGTVTPTSGVTDALGQVSASWVIGATLGAQTLTATSTGLANSPLSISATAVSGGVGGPATTLLFTAGPTNALAGVSNAPSIIVQARDAVSALATTFTGNVTLAIGTNPGASAIGGTVTVAAVGGTVTFPNITLNKTGIGYTLTATSGVLPVATSGTFNISPAAAANFAITAGNTQTANVLTVLPTPLTVTVTDAFTNAVPGVAVGFAITTGGGSLGTTAAVTNAAGQATSIWTLGGLGGAQTVTATSAGLIGSPAVFTATGIVPGLRTWTGATNTVWATATNWSPAGVPVASDSVVVPLTGNLPSLSGVATVKALMLASGATLTISSSTLTVNGPLDATGTITGSGVVVLASASPSSVKGTFGMPVQITNALYLVTGSMSANSLQLMGTGAIDINGQAVTIGTGGVSTAGSATIKMTQPGSALSTTGSASFAGGSETGLLTTGTLTVGGNFSEGGGSTSAFVASSGHTTVLNGSVATNFSFTDPSTSSFGALIINDPAGVTALSNFLAYNTTMTAGILTSTFGASIFGTLTDPSGLLQVAAISFGSSTAPVSATTPTITVGGGSVTFNNNPSILAGNLAVNAGAVFSLGNLQINGHTFTVNGAFTTQGSGQLTMNNATDSMTVTGMATFGGGVTAGTLTAGKLVLKGNFTQSGNSQAFKATSGHTTIFSGPAAQTITFTNPDSAASGACSFSCFGTLVSIKTGTGMLAFGSDVKAASMNLAADSIIAPTRTLLGGVMNIGGFNQRVRLRRVTVGNAALSRSNLFSVDTIVYYGTGTIILSENIPSRVVGTFTLPQRVNSTMIIDAGGLLTAGTGVDSIYGDLVTKNTGQFKQIGAATDTVMVNGNVIFNGGSETGLLTGGVLDLKGNFSAGSGTMFDASLAHTTQFSGIALQTIGWTTPPVGVGFKNVRFHHDQNRQFTSNVYIGGNVQILSSDTTGVISGAFTITLGGTGVFDQSVSQSAWRVGITNFAGPSVTFFPNLTNANAAIFSGGGTVTLPYDLTMGAVTVDNTNLKLGGFKLKLGSNSFTTQNGGTLEMSTSPSDSLGAGFAYFNGGSTNGKLTKGVMTLSSGLYQGYDGSFVATGGNAAAFSPGAGLLAYFTAPATVAFANPGTGIAASHFWFLQSKTSSPVVLKSDIFVDSLLYGEFSGATYNSDSPGVTVRTITTNGVYNSGTSAISFGTVAVVLNQGPAASTFFQNVSWTNFTSYTGFLFTQNRTSSGPLVGLHGYTTASFSGAGAFVKNLGSQGLTLGTGNSGGTNTCISLTLLTGLSCK